MTDPTQARRGARLPSIVLCVFGLLLCLDWLFEEQDLAEHVSATILGLALAVGGVGIWRGHRWAWWLGLLGLMISLAWDVAAAGEDPTFTSGPLGLGFLLHGWALRLLGHLASESVSPRLASGLQRAVLVLGGAIMVLGMVAIAFELEGGILAATLLVLFAGLVSWRRRRARIAPEEASPDS